MPLFYNRDFEHVNASSSSGNDGSFQIPQDAPLPRPEFQYPYLHWPSYPYYYWPSYSHQEPPSGALERGNSDRLNYTGFDHWSHDNQGEGYGDDGTWLFLSLVYSLTNESRSRWDQCRVSVLRWSSLLYGKDDWSVDEPYPLAVSNGLVYSRLVLFWSC